MELTKGTRPGFSILDVAQLYLIKLRAGNPGVPTVKISPGGSACLNAFVVMRSNPGPPYFVLASKCMEEFHEELGNKNHSWGGVRVVERCGG